MAFQFESAAIDFALKLFAESFREGENVLVSPLSVSLALGMVLNGAAGQTEEEMLKVLSGGMGKEEFREALTGYVSALPSTEKAKFHFADSVWVSKEFKLNRKFEKETEKQYRAVIERLTFNAAAVKKINAWVKKETDGMIDSVIDSASPEAMLYLINALVFDGEWAEIYSDREVRETTFTNLSGEETSVSGMWKKEHIYLAGEGCTGFIKPYAGDRYSFVALLPDEDEKAAEFMRGLTAEKFIKILAGRQLQNVETMIPKFSSDYSAILNEVLSKLGMGTAFGPEADFSGMTEKRLAIGEVIHKTHIEVDERGTKAGAVTAVMMKSMAVFGETPEVLLNRPFVYAIVDNEHLIPLFIGAVTEL
ncbi:MAG: serpin family protein [Lachnospiraceae bacterium]|nr:serpin family protein [Lachnospiraceae bacterium]